jgi:cytochrome c peroxidase
MLFRRLHLYKHHRMTLALSAALLIAGTLFVGSARGFTLFESDSDGWSAEELAVLASLRLSQLPAAPVDPSNAYENSAPAIALGQQLFDDKRLSRNQAVSCASCHDPGRQFQDGRQTGKGVGIGSRRSMPIVAAGYSPWLFWDGRKDSVWSQALGPLEDPAEHGGNRLHYALLVQQHYAQTYQELFGPMPELSGLPQHASPLGTSDEKAAWQAMDEARRDSVSRVFANMGKAIAAYEKTLHPRKSRLDDYLDEAVSGKPTGRHTLDAREVNGLRLFIGKAQCISCHSGPLFTDQHFHNTGVPQRDANQPDRGRAAALEKVRQDEFNCLGRYSDAKPGQCEELRFMVAQDPSLEGAFKTPGLREVALRPPYMHAGQFASLDEVVRHYALAPDAAVGHSELGHSRQKKGGATSHGDARQPIRLSPAEQQDLVAFLRTLSASEPAGAGRR